MQYEMLCGEPAWGASNLTYDQVKALVMSHRLRIPRSLSKDARDLIARLLHPDPTHRLTDAAALRAHPFFANVDWNAVRSRAYAPPWKPAPLRFAGDVANFDIYDRLGNRGAQGVQRHGMAGRYLFEMPAPKPEAPAPQTNIITSIANSIGNAVNTVGSMATRSLKSMPSFRGQPRFAGNPAGTGAASATGSGTGAASPRPDASSPQPPASPAPPLREPAGGLAPPFASATRDQQAPRSAERTAAAAGVGAIREEPAPSSSTEGPAEHSRPAGADSTPLAAAAIEAAGDGGAGAAAPRAGDEDQFIHVEGRESSSSVIQVSGRAFSEGSFVNLGAHKYGSHSDLLRALQGDGAETAAQPQQAAAAVPPQAPPRSPTAATSGAAVPCETTPGAAAASPSSNS